MVGHQCPPIARSPGFQDNPAYPLNKTAEFTLKPDIIVLSFQYSVHQELLLYQHGY